MGFPSLPYVFIAVINNQVELLISKGKYDSKKLLPQKIHLVLGIKMLKNTIFPNYVQATYVEKSITPLRYETTTSVPETVCIRSGAEAKMKAAKHRLLPTPDE